MPKSHPFSGPPCLGGGSCCSSSDPCPAGEGDCDGDDECREGLKCGHNNCGRDGLERGEFDSKDDCCYLPEPQERESRETCRELDVWQPSKQQKVSQQQQTLLQLLFSRIKTSILFYFIFEDVPCTGGGSCCSPSNLCLAGEGDCDRDADCAVGLRCGDNNCPSDDEGSTFDAKDDCCYEP